MSRGSFRRSLPRGRSGLKASPALLGMAVFLVLLVPTLYYLYPETPDSYSKDSLAPDPAIDALSETKTDPINTSEPVLMIKTLDGALLAKVKSSPGLSQIYLENTGSSELHHVEVQADKKTMGILSQLDPGEKKVLAVSGQLEGLKVSALDQSDRLIEGSVEYDKQYQPVSTGGTHSVDYELSTKAIPEEVKPISNTLELRSSNPNEFDSPTSEKPKDSPLYLTITANKSEARKGDVVGYRCLVSNVGSNEFSEVQINCAGKMTSTKFLPPKKELYLDGIIAIENNSEIIGSVQGKDAEGRYYTNNISTTIWMISPKVDLEVEAPKLVHQGDSVTFLIRITNNGSDNLTDIDVFDDLGEIGHIPSLSPASFRVLQKERVVLRSMHEEIRVSAYDTTRRKVFASKSLDLRVLNSSLQIQSLPAVVRSYPGKPAEVTWILSNTGEEVLKNLTLDENGKKCMLKELPPGKTIRMAAIYNKESTSWINVTAYGIGGGGYATYANGSVLLTSIKPEISLKIMPPEIEACPGETADISSLVTNSGDDCLTDVTLSQDGSILATIGRMEPGQFKVIDTPTVISGNTTLHFTVTGKDALGQSRSESVNVNAMTVVSAIKAFVSASPPTVTPGSKAKLTCTVVNTGSIPLYSIFVISKEFGPLGNIDYLAPKRQIMITAEKTIDNAVDDKITVEGFTQDKKPVRGSCLLNIGLLNIPGLNIKDHNLQGPAQESRTKIAEADINYGNQSLPLELPDEKETITKVTGTAAKDVDHSAVVSNNMILDGISNLLRYVEKMLGSSNQESASSAARDLSAEGKESMSASNDYELSIAGVKGSEHGVIKILDVSALPSQPAAGEPVKITVHMQSQAGIKSASVKYGLSDLPLTKQDMLGVDRVYDSQLLLESGNSMDGYWSCTVPGKASGTYMVLSVWMTDGANTAEGGPYMIHWSTVNTKPMPTKTVVSSAKGNGMLFIESSSVKGKGEVSIKDTFQGAAMHYNEKMIGNGSISLETMRCIDRKTAQDNFTEMKDLVFTGGNLKGHQTVESPTFHGGMGASVTERFNLSHVDKSETSGVSSASLTNNTLAFKTDQAFDGTWNIQTKYAKFSKKIKADQQYKGSFQTQKSIKFEDAGQR
jgi:hypothetical protein